MIPLQPNRDSFTLQSRTAPVREPLRLMGLGHPEAKQVRTWRRSGPGPQDTASDSQTQPFVSARADDRTLYRGFSPRVSGLPVGQSCLKGQTEPPWGAFGLQYLGNVRLLCMGLGEQSLSDALHATTVTMRQRKLPHGGGNPLFLNLSFNLMKDMRRRENYA